PTFNRLSPDANPISPVRIWENKFWEDDDEDGERFKAADYKKDVTTFVQHIDSICSVVDDADRIVEEQRLPRFVDTEKLLGKVAQKLQGEISKLEYIRTKNPDELKDHWSLTEGDAKRIVRGRRDVEPEMKTQIEKLGRLKELYESERIRADSSTIRDLLSELADVKLEYNMSVDIDKGDGEVLKLYLVTSQSEDSE
ncbi:MAG: hypothetical protein ABGZ35_09765, partial [Planctomycetaceae bacterium]